MWKRHYAGGEAPDYRPYNYMHESIRPLFAKKMQFAQDLTVVEGFKRFDGALCILIPSRRWSQSCAIEEADLAIQKVTRAL